MYRSTQHEPLPAALLVNAPGRAVHEQPCLFVLRLEMAESRESRERSDNSALQTGVFRHWTADTPPEILGVTDGSPLLMGYKSDAAKTRFSEQGLDLASWLAS